MTSRWPAVIRLVAIAVILALGVTWSIGFAQETQPSTEAKRPAPDLYALLKYPIPKDIDRDSRNVRLLLSMRIWMDEWTKAHPERRGVWPYGSLLDVADEIGKLKEIRAGEFRDCRLTMGAVVRAHFITDYRAENMKLAGVDMYIFEPNCDTAIAVLPHGELKRLSAKELDEIIEEHKRLCEELFLLQQQGCTAGE